MASMGISGTRRTKEKSAFVSVLLLFVPVVLRLSGGDVSVGVVGAGTVDHRVFYP